MTTLYLTSKGVVNSWLPNMKGFLRILCGSAKKQKKGLPNAHPDPFLADNENVD